MKFFMSCKWDNGSKSATKWFRADTYEKFCDKTYNAIRDTCGLKNVEEFNVSKPFPDDYKGKWDGVPEFHWDRVIMVEGWRTNPPKSLDECWWHVPSMMQDKYGKSLFGTKILELLVWEWGEECQGSGVDFEVSSFEDLFEKMSEFFDEDCELGWDVGRLEINKLCPEKTLYAWDAGNLVRSKTLEDIWDDVKKEIKGKLGEDFFNKGGNEHAVQ